MRIIGRMVEMMARGEVEVGVRNPVTCLLTTQEYTDNLFDALFPHLCLDF